MKILVLNGSPKKKSDTFRLTDAFLKGMNRGGGHEAAVPDGRIQRDAFGLSLCRPAKKGET